MVCAMLLGVVALTGCTTGPEPAPSSAVSQADSMWQSRTAHLGENSKVIALTADAGFGAMGTQTLTLHTESTPYALTVAYTALDKPFNTVDFTPQATLLLGTIANLDRVEVTAGTDRFALTSTQASANLGFDVKELGRNKDKLLAYSRSLAD
ncbi:hypothetical protein BA895_22805 [Humibacillus sp. DSM 29435]|nr:hypothetical protein BA895_22805 [Humibacillus sp. DSM 29435]